MMRNVVQVMFPMTKAFAYCDSNEIELVTGDIVVVETDSGIDSAIVKKAKQNK